MVKLKNPRIVSKSLYSQERVETTQRYSLLQSVVVKIISNFRKKVKENRY